MPPQTAQQVHGHLRIPIVHKALEHVEYKRNVGLDQILRRLPPHRCQAFGLLPGGQAQMKHQPLAVFANYRTLPAVHQRIHKQTAALIPKLLFEHPGNPVRVLFAGHRAFVVAEQAAHPGGGPQIRQIPGVQGEMLPLPVYGRPIHPGPPETGIQRLVGILDREQAARVHQRSPESQVSPDRFPVLLDEIALAKAGVVFPDRLDVQKTGVGRNLRKRSFARAGVHEHAVGELRQGELPQVTAVKGRIAV